MKRVPVIERVLFFIVSAFKKIIMIICTGDEIVMTINMKETIAQGALSLLLDDKVKKLTVKDIVDKCQITRQTFYYHFADITELFRWILEKGLNRCYLGY